MSISNIIRIENRLDSSYSLKKASPLKASLKGDINQPLIEDSISISPEAKNLIDEGLKEYLDFNSYSQEEDSNNPLKIQLQCFIIAMRIISGDKVPNKDIAFIAEHDPEMLGRALLLARTKENPKDYKTIVGDKKANQASDLLNTISFKRLEISIDLEI